MHKASFAHLRGLLKIHGGIEDMVVIAIMDRDSAFEQRHTYILAETGSVRVNRVS